MGIKREKVPKPIWYGDDFADASTYDLFSEDRWGISVEWGILLEQAKKIDSIVLLIDKHDYPSRLFLSYLDILEANLYIYSDLFFYLIGEHMGTGPNPHDFFQKGKAGRVYKRLFFWNLDCRDSMSQIHMELVQVQSHFLDCLKQEELKSVSSRVAKKWYWGFYLDKNADDPYTIKWFKDRAYDYAIETYREEISPEPLVKQIVNILNILSNAIYFFNQSQELPRNCFSGLLGEFRKSEQGQNLIKAWERDLDGSRDRLIDNMEKTPELCPWVQRYLHTRENGEEIEQLFYDNTTGFMLDDKEYYNTSNWISILKIATLLREYDERHSASDKKPSNSRPKTAFVECIIDPTQAENILKRLHELIDGKKPKACILTIFAAQQKGWLTLPSHSALFKEFPEIGDRKNLKYYVKRKDNYKDDIDAIEKSL